MLLEELLLACLEIEYPNNLGEAYFRSLLVGLGFEIEFISLANQAETGQ